MTDNRYTTTITSISTDTFARLGPILGHQSLDTDSSLEFSLQAPSPEPSSTEAEAQIKYTKTDPPAILVRCDVTRSLSRLVTVRAPAEEWMLGQTVDDGNLLTELVVQTQEKDERAGVSVYGPPAEIEHGQIRLNVSEMLNEKLLLRNLPESKH
jgi:hypothetical protein